MSLLLSDIFPEFLNVGSNRLTQLSGGWLQSPVAKECGVERVGIGQSFGMGLPGPTLGVSYVIKVDHDRNLPLEEQRYRFPVESLLDYLIENAMPVEQHGEMKARIPRLRARDPVAYEKFKTAVPQRLYIACKHCGEFLESQMTLYPGEDIKLYQFDPLTCPRCGQTCPIATTDFFTMEDWTKRVSFDGMRAIMENDPTIKPFFIRIKTLELGSVMPFMNSINDREFEGRPPETVMFMGMNKGPRGHFADLIFAERPVSFNKFQHPDSGDWDHLVNANTGEVFLPYKVADFTALVANRLEIR